MAHSEQTVLLLLLGIATACAKIEVTTGPSVNVNAGEEVLLNCILKVDKQPIELKQLMVQWFHRGKQIAEFDNTVIIDRQGVSLFANELKNGNASLLISRAKVEDSGNYRCYVYYQSEFRMKQIVLAVQGDDKLTAEDNTNDQHSQSSPTTHGLSDVDSQDSLDDELQAGPSGVPQTQRSQAPILPTNTSAATTTQQTPAGTASTNATTTATTATATNTTRTTSTTSSTHPVPRDDHPTPTAVEGRDRVRGPPVASEEVRGSRARGRARITTRSREEWTPSFDHFIRVVEAYPEVQGQSGWSDELLRELILLMRSIDNRLGQMVDLMGQQVALQRDRPVSQPPPPSPSVAPQDDSAPSTPAPTVRDESPDAAGHSAGPPLPKRSRGHPKRSLGVSGGKAPTTRQSQSQP